MAAGLARAGAAVLIAGVIVASYVIVRRSRPYAVEDAALRGWTLKVAEAGSPAIVALQPAQQLQEALFRQISQRAGEPVLAPEHPALSLVLQNEYADSLQGVLSTEDIIDAAKDAGIETAQAVLEECAKLGISAAVVPEGTTGRKGPRLVPAATLRDALRAALTASRQNREEGGGERAVAA